jgi:hypothetical protein
VQLYSYDLVSTPRGVTLCDAREVVPREHLFLFDNPFSGTGDIAPEAYPAVPGGPRCGMRA